MKATEINISNLVTEAERILSRIERLEVRIESYISPAENFTKNDGLLEWALDKARDTAAGAKDVVRYLWMISKEENNG